MKSKFILIGYGWRADFYQRIARELPEQFELSCAVLRTQERAYHVSESYGIQATTNLEQALATNPDYAVLCVPRSIAKNYLETLMKQNVPVLCETPPAQNPMELVELWETFSRLGGKIQVAEQYFLQPLYSAMLDIIGNGIIGDVSNMTLSALHGYHAISIFRKMLGVGFENCLISGRQFRFPVISNNSRNGYDSNGTFVFADRDLATLQFAGGKVAFFDFAGEQYFSRIRTRRLNIQGLRGEINDMTVRFLNNQNDCIQQELYRIDEGIYNNNGLWHQGIQFGDKFAYENPFPNARFNDDEIAVAECMRLMKKYVDGGTEFYPLREALQDTYLSFMIEDAISGGKPIQTETQSWG